MGSVARCGVEGGRYVLLAASRLTDRAYAAGDSLAGARPLDDSPCPPGHNTPLPLERSAPASFKRLLGSVLPASAALHLNANPSPDCDDYENNLEGSRSPTLDEA